MEKKDGSLRPCIDYRGLNSITVKNTYPLPLMSSAFERLQGALFFTKLDLRNAYHLVRMREGMNGKPLLIPPGGTLNILFFRSVFRMLPWFFQALVNDVLRDMLDQFLYVYLDDILIFSHSLQEHVQHVRRVLQRLLENGLYVNGGENAFSMHSQSPFWGTSCRPRECAWTPTKLRLWWIGQSQILVRPCRGLWALPIFTGVLFAISATSFSSDCFNLHQDCVQVV